MELARDHRVVVNDLPELQRQLVAEFERLAAESIEARGRFVVALPGGSVAEAFCPPLARSSVDWTRTDIFWTDERAVGPDHPDSNYGMAARLLLVPASVPPERVHRMPADEPDLEAAAARAAQALIAVAGEPPRLDVALLGAGEDGHIASLFPNHPVLTATAVAAAVFDAPKPPPRRLTLGMATLARARQVVVAAFGRRKSVAIRDALGRDGAASPLAELLRRAPSALVLLDRDALPEGPEAL